MSAIPVQNTPDAPPEETLEQKVQRLLTTWREAVAYISSSTVRSSHPAYRELIALGPAVLPFLFRDMEQTHDGHLSSALAAITGAQPVPPEEGGMIQKIAERWLAWARQNGYSW
jgi:hypothetical protein